MCSECAHLRGSEVTGDAGELELLSEVLARYGLDTERWPTAVIVLALSGISRFLLIEDAFGVDVGHAETIAVIEREIAALEGDRA